MSSRIVEVTTTCPDCHAEIDIGLSLVVTGHDEFGPVYASQLTFSRLYEEEEDGCQCGHEDARLVQIAEDQLQADAEAADEKRYNG